MSGINNLFVGENNADAFYIGADEVEVMYLGQEVVYQKGDFVGLKMKSSVELQAESGSSYDLKIKSSEPWTLSVDSAATWVSFSQLTGDTGETVVVVQTTEENQTAANRSTTITATTQSFSAVCQVTQMFVKYVDYISNSALSNNSYNIIIDTGIIPTTATTFRVQGMYKGYTQSNVVVGYSDRDSADYRLFWVGLNTYYDFNDNRVNVSKRFDSGDKIDITCGNYYAKTGSTQEVFLSGVTQTTIDDPHTIKVDVGSWWLKALEIWEGETKVFDGRAASVNNTVGLYDSISKRMFTNQNINIVERTMHFDLYVEQPPSQEIYEAYDKTFYKSNARTYSIQGGEDVVILNKLEYVSNEEFCTLKASGGEYNTDTYFTLKTSNNGDRIGLYQNDTIVQTIKSGDLPYTINGLSIIRTGLKPNFTVRFNADASANWWEITSLKN